MKLLFWSVVNGLIDHLGFFHDGRSPLINLPSCEHPKDILKHMTWEETALSVEHMYNDEI